MADEAPFELGEVVQLSEAARAKAKLPTRTGIVLGFSTTGNQVRVRWDGTAHSQLIHRTMLVSANPPSSSQR